LVRGRTEYVALKKREHAVAAITCSVSVVADKVANVGLGLYVQIKAVNRLRIDNQFEVCTRHSVDSLRDGATERWRPIVLLPREYNDSGFERRYVLQRGAMRIEGGHRAKPSSIQHGGPERNNCPKALSHEKDVAAVN